MLKSLTNKKLAFVDIETTGTSANFGKIIEIGILVAEDGKIIDTFRTLINPEVHVSPFIEKLTGIDIKSLEGAPVFSDIAEKIQELLKDRIFVAHNARFDYGFIKNEFRRLDVNFTATCLCTVRLSRKLYPQYKSHDLSSVIERMGITCINRHRAFDDARALFDFMIRIEEEGRGDDLAKIVDELLKKPSYPQFLDERTVSNMPQSPGVYIFYDNDNNVIYVGKSVNLRNRVLSHFSNDHHNTKEMRICEQTKRVEIRETVGELGALLLESELIKELNPIYNRQLRKTTSLVRARQVFVNGYKSIELERFKSFKADADESTHGIFRSLTQGKEFILKTCSEYKLCPKIFGLEKSKSACFSYQLEKCSGACLGAIDVNDYNRDFDKAFAKRRIKSWPYNGAVRIEEFNGEDKETFVLDNWCLISHFNSKDDSLNLAKDKSFNYDIYKIFAKYLSNPSNRVSVRTLATENSEFLSVDDEYLPVVAY